MMSKKKQRSYSWTCLNDAFKNLDLAEKLESLEKKFNSSDETQLFSTLVNTSTSRKFPYHRWIRYREGYAGELVKEVLRRYPIEQSAMVVDPMCGSGSTMVACNELGIESLGMDVSPYAVHATRCKGYSLSKRQLSACQKMANNLVEDAQKLKHPLSPFDKDLEKYFDPSNLQQLVNLKREVRKRRGSKSLDVLEFALLAVLEDCSNRKKDGNGLATRPTKVTDCYQAFLSKVDMLISDYSYFPHSAGSTAILHDAKFLNSKPVADLIGSRRVDAIVFSPPYANSFDYFESYKLELIFSEWTNLKEIGEKRKSLIRNYRLGYKQDLVSSIPEVELLCEEIRKRIPEKEERTGVRDGRTRLVPNMLRAYFEDMREVIKNGMLILSPGGHMHIVVDQSAYVGVAIPTDTILALIADDLGHEVVEITQCRKANTSGQQLKQHPYLGQLLRETIVTIKKH